MLNGSNMEHISWREDFKETSSLTSRVEVYLIYFQNGTSSENSTSTTSGVDLMWVFYVSLSTVGTNNRDASVCTFYTYIKFEAFKAPCNITPWALLAVAWLLFLLFVL